MVTTTVGASFASARRIFIRGTNMFGEREIKSIFGLDVPVPLIPWIELELQLACQRGEVLVYQPEGITMQRIHEMRDNKTSDDKPLFCDTGWYKEEEFFTHDSLRPGWRLVSREIIPASRNKNYLNQTDLLTGEVAAIYHGIDWPSKARCAVDEFESQKKELAKLLSRDWKEAAQELTALAVNVEFREKPVEALWLLALYEGINRERLLPSGSWSWTNTLSSSGYVVNVGRFDENGVRVDDDNPRGEYDCLGLRVSRSHHES